jgi:hypothetical protein
LEAWVSKAKLGRNDPCWCNSGRKYKLCHWGHERNRVVTLNPELHPSGAPATFDFRDDIANIFSGFDSQLSEFCKSAGSYFFHSAVRMGDVEVAVGLLQEGKLAPSFFIDAYRRFATRKVVEGLLQDACENLEPFTGRREILMDAVAVHFEKRYSVTVPVLFAQMEGILRKIGGLEHWETMRPTIPRDIWGNRLLFSLGDNASDFNAFISGLYKGQETGFNRNAVLHGFNLDYQTEENSLILLLCLLEIRTFLWFERNTKAVV